MTEQYLILDVTNTETDGDAIVVCQGKTREEAWKVLPEHALMGRTYQEVRCLGAPIQPKERKAVTLSRVGDVAPANDPVVPEPAGTMGSGETVTK